MATDYGIQTFRADGSVAMDGSNRAGIFIEVLRISGQDQSSKVYPDIPAGSLYYLVADSTGSHTLSVGTDGAGRAKLIWNLAQNIPSRLDTYVMVFAKNVSHADTFGAVIAADNGDILADYTYKVPQWLTTRTTSGGSTVVNTPDGKRLSAHGFDLSGLSNTDNKIVLMNLPDSTADDSWYACTPFIAAGAAPSVTIYCLTSGPQHKVPSIHIFSLDGPIQGGGTFGLQCFKSDGTLVYDSSAENVSVKASTTIFANGNGEAAVNTTLSLPTACGVAAPFYNFRWYDVNNITAQRYLGMVQRKGSVLSYQNKLVEQDNSRFQGFLDIVGNVGGGGVMVADIAQLSPSLIQF